MTRTEQDKGYKAIAVKAIKALQAQLKEARAVSAALRQLHALVVKTRKELEAKAPKQKRRSKGPRKIKALPKKFREALRPIP